MTSLVELQRSFQRHVRTGDVEVAARVAGTERVPVATRLQIYSDAYRLRLIEALAANYPRLEQWLGHEDFSLLAQRYIADEPSRYKSIRWFGDTLAARLERSEREQPWLAELARWEWSVAAAFDATDAAPIGIEDLAEVAPDRWPGLRFSFHASLHRLDLDTNAVALYKALAEERAPPDARSADREAWVIWRRGSMPQYRPLVAAEAAALDSLRARETFEQMCEHLCDYLEPDTVPTTAAGYLQGWIADDMVTEVG